LTILRYLPSHSNAIFLNSFVIGGQITALYMSFATVSFLKLKDEEKKRKERVKKKDKKAKRKRKKEKKEKRKRTEIARN
jgi:predicted membrane protein